MILECDIGNTRCKWRVVDGDACLQRGVFPVAGGFGGLQGLQGISRIRVSCVASETVRQSLCEALVRLGVEPEFAVAQAFCAGVKSGYEQPERLGIDRWLALLAASCYGDSGQMVVDAGSALTLDLLNADGRHLGGYITPGLRLMKKALLADTGGVRFEMCAQEESVFGCSTAEAVNAGVMASLLGCVQVGVAEADRLVGAGFTLILTGGDADWLHARLKSDAGCEVKLVPDLVLDGLRVALP